jgi:hypothetical protein
MYSLNYHTLQFDENYERLLVVDSDAEVIADFDLIENDPAWEVKVVSNAYVVSKTDCTDCVEVFAIDIEADAGSVTVNGKIMTGLGIIDLRDTGRYGSTIGFDMAACPVIIKRFSGAFGLRFSSSAESTCFIS